MDLLKNKKSEAITLILIIVIIAVFLGWLINFTSRECRSNSQCPKDNYCGSDFSCHQIPVIEKTVAGNNLVMPSIIIGIAIILSSIILKSEKMPFRKNPRQEASQRKETTPEQAYKNPIRMP